MFKLQFNKYIFINLLFQKRAYADGPPPVGVDTRFVHA